MHNEKIKDWFNKLTDTDTKKIIFGLFVFIFLFLIIGVPLIVVDPLGLYTSNDDTPKHLYVGDYQVLNKNCLIGNKDIIDPITDQDWGYLFNETVKRDIETATREEYGYLIDSLTTEEKTRIFEWIGNPTYKKWKSVSINLPIIGTDNLIEFINKFTKNLPENIIVELTNFNESAGIFFNGEPTISFLIWDPSKESCIYDSLYLDITTYASKKVMDNWPNKPNCVECTFD